MKRIPFVELGPWYPYHDEQLEEVTSALEVAEKQTKLQLEVGSSSTFLLTSLLCCPCVQGRRAATRLPSHRILFLEKVMGKSELHLIRMSIVQTSRYAS